MMRRAVTAVIERDTLWCGDFATEPWEAAWATEAIFYVRLLEHRAGALRARVQVSPDGICWVDEGTTMEMAPEQELAFVRVRHFGGWLRLVGALAAGEARVIVYLSLKE